MSTAISRTRSLRKPAEREGRSGRVPGTASGPIHGEERPPTSSARGGQSPSRLPVKPTARITTAAISPSTTGSATSNDSKRPPQSRTNTSKFPAEGLRRSSSNQRSNHPPAASDPVKQDRSRPPLTQSKHLRNASVSTIAGSSRVPTHTRNKSFSTAVNESTTLRPPSRDSGAQKLQSSRPEPQSRKPTFSTLQQHFSPAKSFAPKPHPAAFLAPPSPSKLPANKLISAETAKLQNELFQLHLLHENAGRVDSEWRRSAKRQVDVRFQSVVSKHNELVELDLEQTRKFNIVALKQWQDNGTPGWGLAERVQMLDDIVTGVWNLGESGGKYSRTVRKFERWLSRCQELLRSRAQDEDLEEEAVFIEELDSEWKDDCLITGRRLETWRDQLRDLGPLDSGSSLARVLEGFTKLINGMLAELNMMAQIERDTVNAEAAWITHMNDESMDDDNDEPVAGAVWRVK